MFSLKDLSDAVLLGEFDKTKTYLESKQFDLNVNNIEYSVPKVHTNFTRKISLPSVVHLAVHKNNPIILSLLVNVHKANVIQLEEDSKIKFLWVLINRNFDSDASVISALNSIDILYRSGAALSNSVVSQLIIFYNTLPENRDNLRKIIQKLYILKATHEFLDAVKKNDIKKAARIRNTNINKLYKGLERLEVSGYINPNYNGGVHGMAILLAAEHPGTQMLYFLSEMALWPPIDFSLVDEEGVTIFHILAKTGNINGLEDVCKKLSDKQKEKLLIAKTGGPNKQQYTPVALARQYGHEEVETFLKKCLNGLKGSIEFVLTQAQVGNPDKLSLLVETGYSFVNRHPVNEGNFLHYAVLGKKAANLRWLWNKLSIAQKIELLLQQMKINAPAGEKLTLTPAELAKHFGYQDLLDVLSDFAIELAEVADAATLKKLKEGGYHLKRVNFSGRNILHYAVLGRKIKNIVFLLDEMGLDEVVDLSNQKNYYDIQETPLEMAQDLNFGDVVELLQESKRLKSDLNQPHIKAAFLQPVMFSQTPVTVSTGQFLQNRHQGSVGQNSLFFAAPSGASNGSRFDTQGNNAGSSSINRILGKRKEYSE